MGNTPCADRGTQLTQRIRELVEGLWFDYWSSEGDEPIKAFHRGAELGSLSRECFAAALKLDLDDPADQIERWTRSLTGLFENLIERNGGDPVQGQKARELVALICEELRDLTGVLIGRDLSRPLGRHPVYVVGLAPDGDIVGFQSHVIWT